jgi:hypothetical protein
MNHALEAVKRQSEKQKRQRDNWKRRAVAYEQAIRETLADNGHLADGEDCTLIKLKRVLSDNAPHQARSVASRPECGCSAIS